MPSRDITNLRGYGDTTKLAQDAKTFNELFDRQGINWLVDVVADRIGYSCQKLELRENESVRVVNSLVQDLREQLFQRI